jgi:hypothetical protein
MLFMSWAQKDWKFGVINGVFELSQKANKNFGTKKASFLVSLFKIDFY